MYLFVEQLLLLLLLLYDILTVYFKTDVANIDRPTHLHYFSRLLVPLAIGRTRDKMMSMSSHHVLLQRPILSLRRQDQSSNKTQATQKHKSALPCKTKQTKTQQNKNYEKEKKTSRCDTCPYLLVAAKKRNGRRFHNSSSSSSAPSDLSARTLLRRIPLMAIAA